MKKLYEHDEKSAKGHKVWKKGKINPTLIPTVINIRGRIPAFLEPNFVYIGRKSTDWLQSKWANPFKMKNRSDTERRRVLREHKLWLPKQKRLINDWDELVARILGCWCAPKPCHGNTLAAMVKRQLSKFDSDAVIVIRAMKPYIGE